MPLPISEINNIQEIIITKSLEVQYIGTLNKPLSQNNCKSYHRTAAAVLLSLKDFLKAFGVEMEWEKDPKDGVQMALRRIPSRNNSNNTKK